MAQIMKANFSDSGLRQCRNKQAVVKIIGIKDAPVRRRKHQLVCDVRFTLHVGGKQSCVPQSQQNTTKFPGHVNASRLLALGRRVLAPNVVMLNKNVAIRIILVFAEVKVAKLKCYQLTTPEAGSKCSQEKPIVVRAELLRRIQKTLDFRLSKGNTFLIPLPCSPRPAAQTCRQDLIRGGDPQSPG